MSKNSKNRKRTKAGELPQILHHKTKNLAYVWLGGRSVYLGKYDGKHLSPEIEENRRKKWLEYLAKSPAERGETVTVGLLVDKFLDYAEMVYRKNGRSTVFTPQPRSTNSELSA